jgi:hypothetical protein
MSRALVPAPLEGDTAGAASPARDEERDAFAGKLAYRVRGRWRSEAGVLLAVAVQGAGGQQRAAERLGISQQAISRLLAGQARPGLELGALIELAYGIEIIRWTLAPNTTAGCVTDGARGAISE